MINFKRRSLQAEWGNLLYLNTKLVYIVLTLSDILGGIVITHILRTEEQQRKFYPRNPRKKSVHQYWRGVDIRTRGLDKDLLRYAIERINYQFPYGKGKVKTCVHHDIGKGDHLHIQTATKDRVQSVIAKGG